MPLEHQGALHNRTSPFMVSVGINYFVVLLMRTWPLKRVPLSIVVSTITFVLLDINVL